MATTTNYGWTTPDDTALVKDGASAIRTLGSSVDTTTKNLNPETTLGDLSFRSSTSNVNTRIGIGSSGQFLSVVGGVPAWATATDQTPLTTKGDIFTFSTVDARLAVGTNGQVLTADSSEATGLKFATPAGVSFVGCSLTNSAAPTISNDTDTTLAFDGESYDTNSFHDNSSNNSRITIPSGKGGKYLFTASFRWNNNATGRRIVYLKKNGSAVIGAFETSVNSTTYPSLQVNVVADAVATDFFTLVVYQTSGGNLAFLDTDYFYQASYLGA